MDDEMAVALLSGAVSIPSPSGGEAELADWLHAKLEPLVDSCAIDEAGNVIAQIGAGPTRLYCLGHIDTVPGHIPVRIEDGWLWGRGSVDAKGSFCSHAAGVNRAFTRDPGLRDSLSVTLIGAVGEEAPHSVGARHAVSTLPPPDLLLIGEPSGWEALTLGYKGNLQLTVEVTRPEAHSAGPEPSAGDCLVKICAIMLAAAKAMTPEAPSERGQGLFGRVQATVTAIGSASDGLQQSAKAKISVRLPPGVSSQLAERVLRQAVPPVQGETRVQLSSNSGVDAVMGPKDSMLSRSFRAAIRARGGRPAFKVKTGTSDMNVVAPSWPAPVLAYGPGDSALDHTPRERLAIAEYLKAVEVMALAVGRLGSGVSHRT